MTTTTASPSENPVQKKIDIASFVGEIGLIALIAALVALAFNIFAVPLLSPQQPASKIAFVNYEQLVGEYVLLVGEDVLAGKVLVSDVTVKSNQFTQEIMKRLQAHAEDGTTVLRTESVVAAPAGVVDLTEALRTELVAAGFLRKDAASAKPVSTR